MNDQTVDHLDDYTMTPTGTRTVKVGMMQLVRGPAIIHDHPAGGGPGYQLVGQSIVGLHDYPKEGEKGH